MKTLYSLLFSILFSLTSVVSIGQAELISEYHFNYDTELLFVHQNKVLIEPDDSDVQLFDLETNEVIQVFPGTHRDDFQLNGDHFALISDTGLYTLQFTEEGITQNPLPISGEYAGEVYLPHLGMPQELVALATTNGLVITNGTNDLFYEVELDTMCLGWSSTGDNLMVYSANQYYLLDDSFSVVQSGLIPSDHEVLENAAFADRLILRETNSQGLNQTIHSFDITNETLEPVSSVAGVLLQIVNPGNVLTTKRHGSQLILKWHEKWDESYPINRPHRLAKVDLTTGVGYLHPLANNLLEDIHLNPSVNVNSKVVAFGSYSKAGLEPHLVSEDSVSLLRDIYHGFGPSLELEDNVYPSHPLNEFTFTVKSGNIYFVANHPKLGRELWRTDGTSEGTVPVLDLEPGPKGLDRVRFLPNLLSETYIFFEASNSNEYKGIFKLPTSVSPIEIKETPNEWESMFGLNDAGQSSTLSPGYVRPDLYPAEDGSVAFLNAPNALRTDWIGYNTYKHANYFDSTWAWGGVVHVLEEDGSARFIESLSFEESSSTPTMARDYDTGDILISIPHRFQYSRYGNKHYHQGEDGNHFVYLNSEGSVKWEKFIPLNQHIIIREIEFVSDGFVMLGEFAGTFSLGHGIEVNSNYTETGFVLKMSKEGEPLWLKAFSEPDNNFGSANYHLAVDQELSKVYAFQGSTAHNVISSCAHSNWGAKIKCFDLESGIQIWTKAIESTDIFRVTELKVSRNNQVWVVGYTRGDLTLDNQSISIQQHYESCPFNSFYWVLSNNGETIVLQSDEPSKQKLIQDVAIAENVVYVLSLVLEEDVFVYDLLDRNAAYSVQLDVRSLSGRLLDSQRWPTGLHWIEDIREHKMSLALHPEEGVYISGQNMYNGLIDNFSSLPSKGLYRQYFLVQRRSAPKIDLSFADEVLEANDEQFLFPNPVNTGQYVNLLLRESDLEGFENLIFYDNTGRQVFSYQLADDLLEQRVRIPNDLSDGLYVVRLEGKELKTMKLIVRRW